MIPVSYNPLIRVLLFIVVGCSAAMVHLAVVFLLVHLEHIKPLIANVFAFGFAFFISYLGHKHLTFAELQNQQQLSLPHFFLVAASSGLLNETLYYLLLTYTSFNYLLALFLVLGFVAVYTFLASRFWACRDLKLSLQSPGIGSNL